MKEFFKRIKLFCQEKLSSINFYPKLFDEYSDAPVVPVGEHGRVKPLCYAFREIGYQMQAITKEHENRISPSPQNGQDSDPFNPW